MIENKIDELIAAIHGLTIALNAKGEAADPEPAPKAEKPKAEPKAEKPKDEPAPAPAPKAASTSDLVAEIENKCRSLTRKDPKTMRTAIFDLLEGYGSKTIKGVPADKLDELSAKLDEMGA